MGPAFWRELPLAMQALGADDAIRAVVIAARGREFEAPARPEEHGRPVGAGSGDGQHHGPRGARCGRERRTGLDQRRADCPSR